ncbi:glycosyltransferase family 2 protein [Bacteroides sp. UBA939]|uniref:glycosyltransferase family 2 protein n=1 Tax=Bacteroides sp. UBA939 TaxID=1946092 RepID=UPI0025BE60BA|nr:glycosyltransferase [Bacteroides sp. UBA939]
MLSILIPVYNVSCVPLVRRLHAMALLTKVPFEILLADDASCEEIKRENRVLNVLKECRILELNENHGPAFVRNYLGEQACYPYLLFLDTDTRPAGDDFLSVYLDCVGGQVVCGGFLYQETGKSVLRYKYGVQVEVQSAVERNRHPYQRFISMNFFIPKETFLRVCFDETFHLGYEDTVFGKRLEEEGIPVLHIENPVWHLVEEDASAFLAKTRRSVRNLLGYESELLPYVRLLRWYNKVKQFHAVALIAFIFRLFEGLLEANLIGKHPSLWLFAFYKLGYLCRLSLS